MGNLSVKPVIHNPSKKGSLMPLVIQFHDDLSCPTIVCDWCQEPITDAGLGGYFFPFSSRTDGTTVPITFLHKGGCDDAYKQHLGNLRRKGVLPSRSNDCSSC